MNSALIRLDVFIAVKIQTVFFWAITLFSLADGLPTFLRNLLPPSSVQKV
jgi:hypothetical protein